MAMGARKLGRPLVQHQARRMQTKSKKENRPNSYRRGYATPRWKEYRARYIIAHPFCRMCEKKGKEVPTYAVDHIKRVTGPDDPLFWDEANHQPLCKSHHAWKIAKFDGGFGNKRKEYHEHKPASGH